VSSYNQKPAEVSRNWYIVDATSVPLGRLATITAEKLTGKHKPTYTPHVDGGDGVIVINASKVKVTGKKYTDKMYYRHSGYPGGLKTKNFQQEITQHPQRVISRAVAGMLPDNKLRDRRLKRLKVYKGEEHPHSGQQPVELNI
jgi:large subunit ribosomal protein L13